MGLAGRKVKQRIRADPRNLAWADDASKFGASYLTKFGWNSSQGLGVSGDGRTSHLKVSQKLDMLGIGAAQSKDPNGIAWKQSKDFESLLRRLNEGAGTATTEDEKKDEDVEMEGASKDISHENEEKKEKEKKKEKKKREESEESKEEKEKKKKKRKREESAEDSKQEKEKEKKRKKSKDGAEDEEDEKNSASAVEDKVDAVAQPKRPVVPRHKAHRARAIAAKSIASKSAASISEILGIAPTPSSSMTTTAAPTPSGTLTPTSDDIGLEKLMTSTKSVSDYFKERLLVKASGKSTPAVSSPLNDSRNEADVSRAGLGSSRRQVDDVEDDAPRGGLGSRNMLTAAGSSSLGLTSLMQMSKFSSMFTSSTVIPSTGDDVKGMTDAQSDDQDGNAVGEKKSKDKKRRKEKSEKSEKKKTEQEEEDKTKRRRAKEERKREKAEKKKRKSEVEE